MKQKSNTIAVVLVLAIVGLVFFGLQRSKKQTTDLAERKSEAGNATEEKGVSDWKDVELADVATGNKFKISDFEGKPVVLESFAVWCPTCLKQQKEMKKLKDSDGDSIVHISLDTDPNEDSEKVSEHTSRYGFNWLFAVAPVEMTQALIDDFGVGVVNAPGTPVVLICEDQSVRFLKGGLKSSDQLKAEIEKGC